MTPELLKSEADNCDAQSGLSPARCSAAEWEGYARIRPEEAVIGDEFFGRMLTWEVIKTRFQVTGVQVQKPSCRRKQQNNQAQAPAHDER